MQIVKQIIILRNEAKGKETGNEMFIELIKGKINICNQQPPGNLGPSLILNFVANPYKEKRKHDLLQKLQCPSGKNKAISEKHFQASS